MAIKLTATASPSDYLAQRIVCLFIFAIPYHHAPIIQLPSSDSSLRVGYLPILRGNAFQTEVEIRKIKKRIPQLTGFYYYPGDKKKTHFPSFQYSIL